MRAASIEVARTNADGEEGSDAQMDSAVIALGKLLAYAAEDLDMPREVDAQLTARYWQLANWIKEDHSERFRAQSEIYPQGSRRLGLMVQPVNPDDDYDVDLVYRRDILRGSITQSELKASLGEQLSAFVQHLEDMGEDPPELSEGSRCWTLRYRDRFHMDVLPALPNDDPSRTRESSILITDKDLREWQTSDPQGYAAWFESRMQLARALTREAMAKADSVNVQDIPPDTVKTPLQRMVQLLKRHRDLRYQGDRDDKPTSILITTLAARTYEDGSDLPDALRAFGTNARRHIQMRGGEAWVANPVNGGENFADRWRKHPERRAIFLEWLDHVERDVQAMWRQDGLHRVAEVLGKSFGNTLADRVVRRAGNEVLQLRQQGALRVASGGATLSTSVGVPVRPHTFFGGRG